MTLPEANAERCPRCRARRVGKDQRCVECGWRFERSKAPSPGEPARDSAADTDLAASPPPVISPDGRLFWDGQRWIAVPRRGPSLGGVALSLVLGLAIIAGIGVSGYVDLSGLPFSVPVVLEHCAVRFEGTNVIIHYQGIDSQSACRRVHPGWHSYVGPPVGSLACYRQRPLGLTWKVYDTGTMEHGSVMCGSLADDEGMLSSR